MKTAVFWCFLKLAERMQQQHFIGSCFFLDGRVSKHMLTVSFWLVKGICFQTVDIYILSQLDIMSEKIMMDNLFFSVSAFCEKNQLHSLIKCKINFPSFRKSSYLVLSLESSWDASSNSICLLTWAYRSWTTLELWLLKLVFFSSSWITWNDWN